MRFSWFSNKYCYILLPTFINIFNRCTDFTCGIKLNNTLLFPRMSFSFIAFSNISSYFRSVESFILYYEWKRTFPNEWVYFSDADGYLRGFLFVVFWRQDYVSGEYKRCNPIRQLKYEWERADRRAQRNPRLSRGSRSARKLSTGSNPWPTPSLLAPCNTI